MDEASRYQESGTYLQRTAYLLKSVLNKSNNGSTNNNNGNESKDIKHRVINIIPESCNKGLNLSTDSRLWNFLAVFKVNKSRKSKFVTNKVVNTKYTLLTFLPIFFFEQFSRFMNFYFLMIASLQLIRELTPINPITTWTPLIIIFFISGFKEAMDDYRRSVSDQEFNNRIYYRLLSDGSEVPICSCEIHVGDIIRLEEGNEVPCDLLLLQSEDTTGAAYLLTSNLDGESNLKGLCAPQATQLLPKPDLAKLEGNLECPLPNPHLYSFDARLSLSNPITYEPVALSSQQLLLQGTILKNTDYVYCLAVYTGSETKLGKNKQKSSLKLTILDRQIERASVLIFVVQLILVILMGAFGNHLHKTVFVPYHYYLMLNDTSSQTMTFIQNMIIPLRMLLLLSLMIPISLKVSMDICKFMCSTFIGWDLQMYDEMRGPATVANTAVADDLGQIEYLLTDKTGTLTENMMLFKSCSILGKQFYATPEFGRLSYYGTATWNALLDQQVAKLADALQSNSQLNPYQFGLLRFFEVLSLCHNVQPSTDHEDQVVFRGPSPDEEALVKVAHQVGFRYLNEEEGVLSMQLLNLPIRKYKLLHTLDFSSSRKRMSVIVQPIDPDANGNRPILLLTKGADDTVLPHCPNCPVQDKIEAHLQEFAEAGLRTLTVCYRELSTEVYDAWHSSYLSASTTLENRDEALEHCYIDLETDFQLLGCTAIEDKLQPKVPQAIASIREAGIKVWMLTGDKLVTAIQIARSCHLLPPPGQGHTVVFSASGTNPHLLKQQLDFELQQRLENENLTAANNRSNQLNLNYSVVMNSSVIQPNSAFLPDSISNLNSTHLQPSLNTNLPELSLIVDGTCLKWILEDHYLKSRFTQLSLRAHAVVCCRATPKQKGEVVDLIKNAGKVAMAVGDGGNDVIMIQNANIGVGIRGREGLQAARAADLAISRFYHLTRLLLVHGRYSLHRVRFVALYCFYKSLVVCMIQCGYQTFAGYSGTSFLTTYALSLYNALYTSGPILMYILDKDVGENQLLSNPKLYQFTPGRDPHYFFVAGTFRWFGWATLQGLVILYLSILLDLDTGINTMALDPMHSGLSLSFVAYSCVVIVVQLTLAVATNHFTFLNHFFVWGTIVLYVMFTSTVSKLIPKLGMADIAPLFREAKFWLVIVLLSALLTLPYWFTVYLMYANPTKNPAKSSRMSAILQSRQNKRRTRMSSLNGEVDSTLEEGFSTSSNNLLSTSPLQVNRNFGSF